MKKLLLALPCLLLVGACGTTPRSGGYYQDDGPHDAPPVDVSKVPDAVPRAEPLSATGNRPYTVFGVNYTPLTSSRGYRERGTASWYGRKFHGKRTSSGEPYDMYAMTAAHKTLPIPCYVRVRSLENGRSVVVRVNDRGPFLHNRVIDLSYAAAARLGIVASGTGRVEVEAIDPEQPTQPARGIQIIPMAEAAAPPAETLSPPKLAVQVGAFSQAENAHELKTRLERVGLPAYVVAPAETATNRLYRVRLGPVDNVEHGDRLVAEAARHGVADAAVVVE